MALSEQARRNIETILRLAELPEDGELSALSFDERVKGIAVAVQKHCTPEMLAMFEVPLAESMVEMFAVILRSTYEEGIRGRSLPLGRQPPGRC